MSLLTTSTVDTGLAVVIVVVVVVGGAEIVVSVVVSVWLTMGAIVEVVVVLVVTGVSLTSRFSSLEKPMKFLNKGSLVSGPIKAKLDEPLEALGVVGLDFSWAGNGVVADETI